MAGKSEQLTVDKFLEQFKRILSDTPSSQTVAIMVNLLKPNQRFIHDNRRGIREHLQIKNTTGSLHRFLQFLLDNSDSDNAKVAKLNLYCTLLNVVGASEPMAKQMTDGRIPALVATDLIELQPLYTSSQVRV